MHCAVIEFARDVMGLPGADTAENNPEATDIVIMPMEEYRLGSAARLGAFPIALEGGSKIATAYGATAITERHRHRFKFNDAYSARFEAAGMKIVAHTGGKSSVVEAVEIPSHPWFVAVQFHPEYKSNVKNPHPLFVAFVKATVANSK
jgi:CTP synthase